MLFFNLADRYRVIEYRASHEEKYRRKRLNRPRRLQIFVKKPPAEESGGGWSNAFPLYHHTISQLIRGYFIWRRSNRYSPPRYFLQRNLPTISPLSYKRRRVSVNSCGWGAVDKSEWIMYQVITEPRSPWRINWAVYWAELIQCGSREYPQTK